MYRSLQEKYTIRFLSDIVGQNHNISFLQNSLFKNLFHSVYIFAGMRGTGKTTSARLFSYGMQCQQLHIFQKNVTEYKNPCYECESCLAHKNRNHPDLIEIDAASHTGVDTIRAIIDNVYMLPLISNKKIYIIDEAHMLSKAAFNACLKIMEEPPANVHFILATTELNKIIETVRSRSIILYYDAIEYSMLESYLEKICIQEKIFYEKEALPLIVKMAQGSMRDALNIMNKLIMIHQSITQVYIQQESGIITTELIISLLDSMLTNNATQYYQIKENIAVSRIVNKKEFFEDCVKNIQKKIFDARTNHIPNTDKTIIGLHKLLDLLYEYEENFYQSNSILGILDLIFFKTTQKKITSSEPNSEPNITNNRDTTLPDKDTKKNLLQKHNHLTEQTSHTVIESEATVDRKTVFLDTIEKIIATIFKQGIWHINDDEKKICINFKKTFTFYNNYFVQSEKNIAKGIAHAFGQNWTITYQFTLESTASEPIPPYTQEQPTQRHTHLGNLAGTKEVEYDTQKKKYTIVKEYPLPVKIINELMPGKTYIKNNL
jgi:DNA polymerase-3 subunit gamma/tau